MSEKLQKVLARVGLGSRRYMEEVIAAGRVSVNGQVAQVGERIEPGDELRIDGRKVQFQIEDEIRRRVLIYYKPEGEICSRNDPEQRPTVFDNLPAIANDRWVMVGRLDINSTGLLLFTNDGELANQLMHPRYKIDKVYIAKVKGVPTNDELKTLRLGVVVAGKKTAEARADITKLDKKKGTATIQLTIHEGRYHQVKEMLKAVGHPVIKLHRERYGMLDVNDLLSGEYRELRYEEVQQLKSGKQVRRSSGRL